MEALGRLEGTGAAGNKSGPYKPGVITSAAFEIAPDGRFRGMKFKKAELMVALRNLAAAGTIFALNPQTKSSVCKYSAFPIVGDGKGSGSRG